MKLFHLPFILIAFVFMACSGHSPEQVEWEKWTQDMQSYFTDGPSAVKKAIDYRYVELGATVYFVKQDGVITINDAFDNVGELIGSLTHTPSLALWERGDPANKSLPENGAISGLVILDQRYAMIVSTENLTLDENRTRVLFFDDQADISGFKRLKFFPYHDWAVLSATFNPNDNLEPVLLETERGLTKRFFHAGEATFTYQAADYTIPLYTMTTDVTKIDYLFTGFTDATTGKTSYGVGRYLDIDGFETYPPTTLTLDFNRLYNPTCAQSEAYNCPLIPAEIDAPVPFGERYNYPK